MLILTQDPFTAGTGRPARSVGGDGQRAGGCSCDRVQPRRCGTAFKGTFINLTGQMPSCLSERVTPTKSQSYLVGHLFLSVNGEAVPGLNKFHLRSESCAHALHKPGPAVSAVAFAENQVVEVRGCLRCHAAASGIHDGASPGSVLHVPRGCFVRMLHSAEGDGLLLL